LSTRLIIVTTSHSRLWSHSHILRNKVLSSEIVHEILSGDNTTILVIFLHDDLFELVADSVHNLLEFESHRFILVSTDVLVELLVELLDDS